MAASGGNIEWSTTVKPILTSIYGPFFEKNDIIEVIQAIVKSENEFSSHSVEHDLFYTCFACLSAHFIYVNANSLTPEHLGTARDAIKIILKHILKKLSDQAGSECEENEIASACVSSRLLLLSITVLFTPEGPSLSHNDQIVLVSLLNCAILPTCVTTSDTSSKGSSQASTIATMNTSAVEKTSSTTNTRRSDALLEQLTLPLQAQTCSQMLDVLTPLSPSKEDVKEGSSTQSIDKWIDNICPSLLIELKAGSVILKVCQSLPCLQRYLLRWKQAKETNQPPYQTADTLIHSLAMEVNICQLALALPCLEPLTPDRIVAITDITVAWLLCAVTQAINHSKDEEMEQLTGALVESALVTYRMVGGILKNSPRAGGYVYQNHLMMGGWVLVCGLQSMLNCSDGASKTPRVRSSSRLGSVCGAACVALGSVAARICRRLLCAARVEALASTAEENAQTHQPAALAALPHFTALERALRITQPSNIHQLFVLLAVSCYRKATSLKQQQDTAQEQNPTAYCKDMLLMSEEDDSDDDSEPIWGLWFESTLVAPEWNEQSRPASETAPQENQPGVAFVPYKADPISYIQLGTEVLVLLAEEMVSPGCERLGISSIQLQDSHASLMAALVKDLDSETARTDTGAISPAFGQRLGALYASFSSALMRYLRGLVGSEHFDDVKAILVIRLKGGSPLNQKVNYTPLQMGCRAASIVAGVTLSSEAMSRETQIMSHWQKIIHTLTECALSSQPQPDHDYEDLNVEHAQLLVYLFHSLTLMQKKSILLTTANAVIKISETLRLEDASEAAKLAPNQLLLSTRLMLLIEYLMRHLYDPPTTLLQQVEWNLLKAPGLSQTASEAALSFTNLTVDTTPPKSRIYCAVPHIEDAYRKLIEDDKTMRPKFYALTSAEATNQETPKFDGLACNFVLGTPHKLKYPVFIDALLSFLNCLAIFDNYSKPSAQLRAAAHYTFQTTWRLVISMPPSIVCVDKLSAGKDAVLEPPFPLNFTIWAPRADQKKVFNPWWKDALVKQGMYTQYAENLLIRVTEVCDNLDYAAWLASNTIKHLRSDKGSQLLKVISCDAAVLRYHLLLSDGQTATKAEKNYERVIVPDLLLLLETALEQCRVSTSAELKPLFGNEPEEAVANMRLLIYGVGQSSDGIAPKLSSWLRFTISITAATFLELESVLNNNPTADFHAFYSEPIPSETAVLAVVSAHCEALTSAPEYSPSHSFRLLAYSAAKLLFSISSTIKEDPKYTADTLKLIIPAITDGRLQFLNELLMSTLNVLVPTPLTAEQLIIEHVLRTTYPVLLNNLSPETENVLRYVIKYWEKVLDRQAGRGAFEAVFGDEKSDFKLGEILLSAPKGNHAYSDRVVKLFNKIFSGCENSEISPALCKSICTFIGISEQERLSDFLSFLCTANPVTASVENAPLSPTEDPITPIASDPAPTPSNGEASKSDKEATDKENDKRKPELAEEPSTPIKAEENANILASLTKHIVLHDATVARTRVLAGLRRACGGRAPTPQLFKEMVRLADAQDGSAHSVLFPAAVQWMQYCVESLSAQDTLDMLGDIDAPKPPQLESATVLLAYLTDALYAISPISPNRAISPTCETPSEMNLDIDCDDMMDDDDASADDSDEEVALQNRLCSFTVTAREFMNQHWYHCHTCKMVDGVGVCTVCALVCHKGHDVTYAKFGNFFCDCGAKPDGSCKALVKRAGNSANGTMGGVRDDAPAPSIRRRASSPAPPPPPPTPRKPTLATNLQGSRAYLSSFSGWSVCLAGVERLLGALTEPCRASAEGGAAVGAHTRAARALQMLHLGEKQFVNTDHLMMPTIGSQEGAFENVRMSYTGEDGHTIRQLISGHKLRRVAMCCLASPHGRRQHLAVSHEKGKITVLQLSALLKQADTSKHKLTLTRLSSAPIPFTVLTLSGNACNEDLLAVCGLKDCHVLSFNSSGTVSEHFVVNIKLEAGNYIVKAIWLPGSQTQLAIVTSDFIKIFDLAKNLIDPTYHFLVPSGKIRDATFVWQDDAMNMLCMSSSGHINYQPMTEDTLATNGPFYITNTLQILHPEIQDFDGLVCNGGTSIYYSHTLKIMFFSYQGGKSFLAPLSRVEESVKGVALIPLTAANNARGESIRKAAVQGLSGWAEVPGHPGLVTAVTHAGNSPVVFMLTPTSILIQEVKVVPTKAKITDMVAVRHASGATGTEQKTTLMLLCEDGSLRMYTASAEKTGFWLSSAVQPRMRKRAPPTHAHKPMVTKSNSSGEPQFPVDFFEHCVVLSDIEIGGNDLLQVYNVAQIKHRLNTIGLYVVATNEFTMELTQPDAFKVITGVRILIGTQDVARAPTYIEIGGRTIPTKVGARSRWFDIPLTREETLQFANKLTVKFGPSQDPEGVIMVDSVKVYGKDKDQFGWPEETEESATCASTSKVQQDNNVTGWQPTTIETVACGALEVLELGASGVGVGAGSGAGAEAARRLLTAAAAPLLITRSQALLRALYHQNYHVQKDQTILSYVMEELLAMVTTADPRNIDPEAYVRVILLARAVAISRPQHLVKFSPNTPVKPADGDWGSIWMGRHVIRHPAALAAATAWRLASVRDPLPAAPVAAGGLRHRDHALHALIDVLHAFATHSDANMVEFVNHIYLSFLLSEEQSISFGAKAAVMRVLRPRVKRRRAHIPSPPNTPANPVRPIPVAESIATTSHDENQQFVDVDDPMEPMVLLAPGGAALEGLLDIPPDADDETMVELAIALSLQEQPRAAAAAPARYSDTTASAPGSDDEGSTAATDGSTLRTSPADAAGSDSGGSGADSIGGVSGRSSAYGEMISAPSAGAIAAAAAAVQAPIAETTAPESETQRLHALRLTLLTAALNQLPTLRTLPGQRAIPLMQVVLMIAGELDTSVEAEKVLLDKLLDILLTELDMENESGPVAHIRTNQRELRLVLMRLLSVLMARWKTAASAGGACGVPRAETAAAGVSRATASALVKHQAPAYCLRVLSQLLPYWKNKALETTPPVPGQQLLRPQPPQPLPDMQPFFVKEYVKGHALDVFDNYPQLLMEMALRLPCQIHKHCDPTQFDSKWKTLLCEYMMNPQTPLRKQVRKLLLLLCGSRERYRQLRDIHALDTHLAAARDLLDRKRDLVYDDLVVLTEHLKACSETVTARTGNWQQVCGWERSGTLAWLIKAAVRLNAGVAPSMLSLLHSALAIPTANAPKAVASSTAVAAVPAASSSAEAAAEREKSAESDAYNSDSSKFHEAKVPHLVQLIQKQVSQEEFGQFVRVFLLEANSTAMRWKAHALILAIYNNSTPEEQLKLVELMWSIWPSLPQYGRRAAQFVDLIGYFTIKTPNIDSEKYLSMGVELLKSQNEKLSTHPNGALYSTLSNFVEIDGYYLESEPCLVCNNPETPMANIKLPTIKIDSKFTTTTQIVKLVSSHMISRISLRIGDIKRSKMVRTINFFYNNRSVQAVQELKNKPGMWQKAKKVVLQSGQTDVKVDFPLPIVACNLMMEYADFYENQQASGESLQCPRCSASVPANPGVCANCGENVFQCHKCRAINYDEKDPFLCHACGFCKYAKFDYSLTARPCCAVDTIENDDDRKKMLANIGNLLDKADRAYRQLVANKPQLEALVHKISSERVGKVGATADESGTNSNVHRAIQALAHKYCSDTKGHFDDLSKIIQKVLACRKELVAYDRSQSEQLKGDSPPAYTGTLNSEYGTYSKGGGCYGCSLASSEFCVLVLRALASQPQHRPPLWRLGLVSHLVQHNLMRPSEQEATRALVCLVTRDNIEATESVCNEVSRRVMLALLGRATDRALRPLVSLLGALLAVPDAEACWEVRLKTVLRLWIWCSPQLTEVAGIPPFAATILKSDIGIEGIPGLDTSTCPNAQQNALHQVALPCLRYMQQLTSPAELPASVSTTNTTDAELKPTDWGAKTISCWWSCGAGVSLGAWIAGDVKSKHTSRLAPPEPSTAPGERDRRDTHLATKYVAKWRRQVLMSHGMQELHLDEAGWLRQLLFDPSSRHARATAAQMLRSLCDSYDRTKEVLLLLNTFLPDVSKAGEASEQYLELYQSLASISPWKQFLALHGVLKRLADLMTKEIEQLHKLEETTLTSDMSQGYALKRLVELLALLLEEPGARRVYKTRLVGAVLGGYLALRRLVVQRTRLTDDTQNKLLELLEEMTTGTEAETAEFMAVCIETVRKYPMNDYRTPVFIFERLCSIIYPEEDDVGEFFLTLEKDPQQEDFLSGRMLGNPYSSTEPGLGPLMRDVKNKICTDCDLVALLEDDNAMELLVCNKIMSLDLPVKDVYKKVWSTSSENSDTMRVVYRIRGLHGDATEEFVETLNAACQEEQDDEKTYRMANVLADCGGLEVLIARLASVQSASGGAARALLSSLLRLVALCVRVVRCARGLARPHTRAMSVLLRATQLVADDEKDLPRPELTIQLLEIMERILTVAASESLESFLQFSLTFGGPEYVQALLNCTEMPGIRNNPVALGHLTRVLAALVYGNDLKMAMLCEHFKPVFDFDKLDSEHLADEEFRMELFCVLCANIERNAIGGTLKDYLISLGIVRDALQYITKNAPCVKPTLVCTDSAELKEFISRPALKYILRFLTGLATDHEPTQMAVCEKVIPIVHRLEQVSSGEHVGSLAENLLEALRTHPAAAQKVQDARDYTRQEKKRLAMAVRERQLGALGMKSNDRGQVTAQCSFTHQLAELAEEAGAVCCICREGYKYQPTKVLGVYTFTKRCSVEDFEVRARKTMGYTTVSHYNVVHVECHMAAVRLARAREEWESAALQNASTKCNGLLPLWGPHVPESAFASCLARHTTYLQECTGHRDITHTCTIHDIKLLLLRFARNRSFHDDTGGGGPLSNMQLLPAMLHVALYVMNTSRVSAREATAVLATREWIPQRVLESAHDAEGILYYAVLMLALFPHSDWRANRLEYYRRAIITAHARAIAPSGPALRSLTPEQKVPRDFADYKPYVTFIAVIEQLYNVMFKTVTAPTQEQWPIKLAEYIRNNDEANAKAAEKIVAALTDEIHPCASFSEFCDVADLLGDISEPEAYLQELLGQLP